MKKQLNYLAILPFYGSFILFVYFCILSAIKRITKKRFIPLFLLCVFVSFLLLYIVHHILTIIYETSVIQGNENLFISTYKFLIIFFVGGYLVNAFNFILLNRKWNYLSISDEEITSSLFEKNKKRVAVITFISAIIVPVIITMLTFLYLNYNW